MRDCYKKAEELYAQGKYAEAAELYRAAAEQGDSAAQFALGRMYYSGKGVEKDPGEAVRLFALAAEQGELQAMMRLASTYQLGWDIEQSYESALHWFERAAELGSAKAAYRAGQFYAQGLGTEQSVPKALEFWGRSLELDASGEVAYRVASAYYEGKGIPRDLVRARYYFCYANKHGYECRGAIALVEQAMKKEEQN